MHKRGTERARALRRRMSLPEVLLWKRLRGSGLHIRRQHPEGRYTTDFFCAAARTVIEVDGETHEATCQADALRDDYLRHKGIRTVRIAAKDVLVDPEAVGEVLLALLRERIRLEDVAEDLPPPRAGEVPVERPGMGA